MNNITKNILFLPLVLFLVSCGGDSSSDDSVIELSKLRPETEFGEEIEEAGQRIQEGNYMSLQKDHVLYH